MGTLYDLLGALPGDNAESLRTAFRKAAKTAHPDINPDDPDASLRFRELVRAYEILTNTEQRTTYDQLLAIALHPLNPPATKPAGTYERIHKMASSTMAATIISGVLIGGYTLFGHFSKPPSAAEIVTALRTSGPEIAAAVPAAQPDAGAPVEPRTRPEDKASVDEIVTAAVASTVNVNRVPTIGGADLAFGLTLSNLVIQHDPGFAGANVGPAVVLHRMREFDRAFANLPPRRLADSSRARVSATTRRKPLPMRVPLPPMRAPMTAAITP